MLQTGEPLVLASASAARRALLTAAGLRFEAIATDIDEDAVKREAHVLGCDAAQTARRLAHLKARAVDRPGAVVIGCDQILVCGAAWFDKPPTLDVARAHLRSLRGHAHTLATATVALRNGVEVWRHAAAPRLVMRRFTDSFLEAYLAAEGEQVLGSVGAYRLEGLGMHLFDSVQGEYGAILGLPMLPLLGFLRDCGMIAA
jgi:septum formation protein